MVTRRPISRSETWLGLRRRSILASPCTRSGGTMVPRKFNLNGVEVEGVEVDFEALKELVDANGQPLKDQESRQRLVVQSTNELVVQD